MFDLIIIDECHRSIYNLWCQVLDYFDALTLYYQQPQRRQEVTLAQIKEVLTAIQANAPRLARSASGRPTPASTSCPTPPRRPPS